MKIVVIQLINYTLSFLMWMIIGRVFLTLILGKRQNIMTLAFVKVTEPVYGVTRRLLPFVKEGCVPFVSVLLIIIVRLAMIVILRPATQP